MAAGSIIIDLLMKTGAFETDTKRAEKRIKELEKSIKNFGNVVATSTVAAATAFAYMAKASIDNMNKLAKQAQMAGITTESLSGLAYAADLAGVSQDDLTGSLARLAKGMSDASQGTGEALKAFEALNINAKNLSGTDDALLAIADKFEGMADGANKTALAIALFGRSGAQLIPFLNAGRSGIKELTDEAARLGIIIGGETAKQAETFNDNLTKIASIGKGLFNQIAESWLPTLNELTGGFIEATKETNNFLSSFLAVTERAVFGKSSNVSNEIESVKKQIAEINEAYATAGVVSRKTWDMSLPYLQSRLAVLQQQANAELNAAFPADMLGNTPKIKPDAPALKSKDPNADKMANMLESVRKIKDEFNRTQEFQLKMADTQNKMLAMTNDERSVQEAINKVLESTNAEIEKIASKRLDAANAGANSAILAQFDKEISLVKELGDAWAELSKQQQVASIAAQRTFEFGWSTALAQYREDSTNAANKARDMFASVTGNMSSAIANFVETGKISFGSLASSIIKDLIRIQLQAQASKLFGMLANAIGGAIGRSFGTTTAATHSGLSYGYGEEFATGGFTGYGDKYQPAGIVHKGEYVLNADATKRIGVAKLDMLNGFANGGYVGNAPTGMMGNAVNINIKNEAGADGYQATATASRNETGLNVEVLVRRAVTNDMRNNGPMAQSIGGAFGLRRTA